MSGGREPWFSTQRRRAMLMVVPACALGALVAVLSHAFALSEAWSLALACGLLAVFIPLALFYIFRPWAADSQEKP